AVDKLALKIDALDMFLPTYGYSKDGAWPHIEIEGKILHYVVIERGEELRRDRTTELDQLLYWVFADATFSMAVRYELAHREEPKDCRRIMFAHQEKLLGLLNDKWREKSVLNHQNILEKYPYDDLAGLRASYFGKLRCEGHNEDEIKRLVYEKYPE
ncbi:MAG TPA: Imm63 family immunity protein, partial [Mucilaginibacter sp.]